MEMGSMMKKKKAKGASLEQSMGPVATEKDMEWEHKKNHDTVMDAMEIMADPEKMKHVRRLAGRRQKAITSLKDLHNTYQEKFGKKSSGSDGDGDEGMGM